MHRDANTEEKLLGEVQDPRRNEQDINNQTGDSADGKDGWRQIVLLAQQGDESAMEQMVESNVGLIYMVLKRMGARTGNYDWEELFQVGAIGLVNAIRRFNLSTEYNFSTYAVPMIIGEIRRFLRDDGTIHIGRRIKENASRIARCREQILHEKNHEPTVSEIANATGLTQDEIILALGAAAGVESIQAPIGREDDDRQQTLEEQLADEECTDEYMINRITVQNLISKLPKRERSLILLRYMQGCTQSQTAQILGMTQVSVSRLEKKILGKLRGWM